MLIKILLKSLTAFILALSPLKASSETYTIGVVPQFEARELADIWGHVATTLNKNTPYDFAFVGSANIPDFEKKFLNGDFDFIYSNPYHALTAYQQQGYLPIIRDGSRLLKGILVAHIDSDIQSVADLDGALISFPAPNALGASLMTRSDMTLKHNITYTEEYVKTHSSAYLNVFLMESDAAGGVMSSYNKLEDEISSKLKIVYETSTVPPHPISAHPRVRAEVVDSFTKTILTFDNFPNGENTLSRIPMFDPVVTSIAEYRRLEDLALEKFVK